MPVKQITAQELKAMMDADVPLELFDVRTDAERAIAVIEGARPLDQAAAQELQTLDRSTPLVFHCHHGGRSQRAALAYEAQGFSDVSNLTGGIDAWSVTVDPKVKRY